MHDSMKLLLINLYGGFPLSRNFYVRTRVKLTCVNKIEAMYERPRVNVEVEPRSTFTFTRDLSYIASLFLSSGMP